MSKEAIGENGSVLGSSAYWNSINSATFFGKLMQRPSETNYHPYIHFDPPHGGGNGFFRGVSKPIDYNHVRWAYSAASFPNSTPPKTDCSLKNFSETSKLPSGHTVT